MSPEQSGGGFVDGRTDIYALGMILYHMLTGDPPYTADTFAELVIKQNTLTPLVPSQKRTTKDGTRIPPALDALVLQCLAKDADARPNSMTAVENRLNDILVAHIDEGFRSGEMPIPWPARDRSSPSLERFEPWPATLPSANEAETKALPAAFFTGSATTTKRQSIHYIAAGAAAVVLAMGALAVAVFWPVATDDVVEPGTATNGGGQSEPHVAVTGRPAPRSVVTVSFASTPPGAWVFLPGQEQAIGKTPFQRTFERSATVVAFEFRLGPEIERRELTLQDDATLSVNLARAPTKKSNTAKGHIKTAPTGVPTDLRDPWAE
jgi:hypothetical protein